MHSPLKKFQKNKKENIDQQLYNAIYTKVTAENYQENQDETAKKCKRLFKQGANPKTLTELEEILRERQDEQAIAKHLELSKQGTSTEALAELKKSVGEKREDYEYYIQEFLPALLTEVKQSEKLDQEKAKEILVITSDIIERSGGKEYKRHIEFLKIWLEEITQSKKPVQEKAKEIGRIISGIISKSKDESRSSVETAEQSTNVAEKSGNKEHTVTSGSDSDSGVSSREESLESPINSRRGSMSSILSSAGENNDPQKEDTGNQMQPEQTTEEEPRVSSQCMTLGSREKESMDPNSQTTQMTGSQAKDSMQPEEKKDKKNVITTAQKLPVNEKKGEVKQPNNRNLHVALVAGCALSTIGCIVAGAMTLGLVGAGLLAMAAVFAIAAVAELHSNFLSSKLISINVSPLVDDKELTACSQR